MPLRVVFWFALLYPVPAQADYSIDYLYIEAGQGDSSGGHAAIRFGGEVFHYQYSNGLLKAVRQNRKDFEYQYRFLANRTIHVRKIPVRNATYRNLLDYFSHKYRVQSRQFEGLDLIRKDIDLIRRLQAAGRTGNSGRGFRYPIKGAGLLTRASRSERSPSAQFPVLRNFSEKVRQAYGDDFLADRKAQIAEAVKGLQITSWSPDQLEFAQDRYPVLPYSLAGRFADLVSNLKALETIESAGPMKPKALIEADLPEYRLQAPQVEALRRFRNALEQELLKLTRSTRPDWGYPLLLGLARLMVLDQSIQHRKLVFLDTFRPEAARVDPEDIRRYQGTFRRLVAEVRMNFDKAKTRLLSAPSIDEAGYSHLEMLGNHYAELARGVDSGRPIRLHGGRLAPLGMDEAPVAVLPEISRARLPGELGRLSDYAGTYSERLEELYGYDLLARNCVSEIFLDMERALAAHSNAAGGSGSLETESVRQLGGYIDRSVLNSVPFVSSAQVRKNYRKGDSETLLSYRQERLGGMYAAENPLITFLRESNVLTSTVYPWNPDDGFFLFFTDDTVFPRPVFGAFNLIAGIGHMLVGGVISPFHGAAAFIGGVKGVASSLPELVFFNIRKGSYRYQPADPLMEPEARAF